MRIMFLAMTLFGCSASIAQTEAPARPDSPAPTAAPAPEKKVCRSEPQFGSIMTKRTCHTRTEWAAIDAANRANVDRMRDGQSNGGAPRN